MAVRIERIIIIVLTVMLFSVWHAYAGTPAGPGTPPASTSSYTLSDIYNRLDAGTAGSQSTFTEPSAGPATGTMYTLNEIMAKAPIVDNTNGATAASVESGKTFWGLTSGEWGLQTGTASLGGGAGVPKTGQTTCYDASGTVISCTGTGQDGALQKGVAWPNPRFTAGGDNNNDGDCNDVGETCDGTVTDNLTGLIWLKNANCANATRNWATALSDVAQLNMNGMMNSQNCGDTSNGGSHQIDWRLPNVRELQSLVHYSFSNPALPNTAGTAKWSEGDPFTNVQSNNYWSSSTSTDYSAYGWYVYLYDGVVRSGNKANTFFVWPVRGGQ